MKDWQATFEEYRKDRRKRRAQSSSSHPGTDQSAVLEQLAAAERDEAQNERLTREVQEFFADATRTAAAIMGRLTGQQQEAVAEKLGDEIEDFISDVLRRAEVLMRSVQDADSQELSQQELEPQMHNLAGRQLDEFRSEGTANLENKHFGEDPFAEVMAPPEPAENLLRLDIEGPVRPGTTTTRPSPPRPVSPTVPGAEAAPLADEVILPPVDDLPPLPPVKEVSVSPAPPPPVFEEVAPPAEPDRASVEAFDAAQPPPEPVAERPDATPARSRKKVHVTPDAVTQIMSKLAEDPTRMRQALAALVTAGVLSAGEARGMLKQG